MAKQKEIQSEKEVKSIKALEKVADIVIKEDKWLLLELAKH